MKKSSAIIVAAMALALLGACGANEPASTRSSVPITTAPPTTPGPPPEAPPSAVDTTVFASRFAVFQGARDEADELRRRFPHQMIAALGLDLSASRYSRQVYGEPAHLVPARGFVCLYTGNEAVGSCWKPGVIAAGRAIATGLCGPGLDADSIVTFGLVPDGVNEVTILRSNVPDLTVPVEGNVFVGKTSSEPPLPLTVAWTENGKRMLRSSGIPPQVAQEGCRKVPKGGGRKLRPSG